MNGTSEDLSLSRNTPMLVHMVDMISTATDANRVLDIFLDTMLALGVND